jgi:hypothetical protein
LVFANGAGSPLSASRFQTHHFLRAHRAPATFTSWADPARRGRQRVGRFRAALKARACSCTRWCGAGAGDDNPT